MLFDGNKELLAQGEKFYKNSADTFRMPPCLVHAWITRDNVNELLTSNGFEGEIDLLSLDMDGVDFWVWKNITCINPRVIIVEYNNRWDSSFSVAVPYSEQFTAIGGNVVGDGYFGASLAAFNKLAIEKGYRLIGANSWNTNAFFMRNDVGSDLFSSVSVESCLTSRYAKYQQLNKYPKIKHLETIEI